MDSTKSKIIDAATQVFLEKGFSGATISDIANVAGAHKSLIYHHIGNKQALWQVVKDAMLDAVDIELPSQEVPTFAAFVELIVCERIKLYRKQPKLLRLMQWQSLERADNFQTTHPLSPTRWTEHIARFQRKGQLRVNYPPSLIALYIHSLIQGVLMNQFDIFTQHEGFKKEVYVRMIIKETVNTFSKR